MIKIKRNEIGFTLIELMIVIAIVSILSSVAVVKFGQQISKAKDARAISIVSAWRSANSLNYSDTALYAISFGGLELKVQKNVVNLTFSDKFKNTFSGGITQWSSAGKSRDENNMVSFTITGNSLESNIVFDNTNGNDTKGTTWSSY